ncbi:MAG: hypothetical protein N3F09_03365 [Bacteroidia bacterium]|nr:hypothetical protein [Bacteroidia bacterium]
MARGFKTLLFLLSFALYSQCKNWEGVWKGKMEFQPENKYGEVWAELHIKERIKDSVLEWKLLYVFKGKEKKDERPY